MSNDMPGGKVTARNPGGQHFFNDSSRGTIAASFAFAGALAVYYHLCWPTFHDFVHAVDFCDIPFCDFVVFYYKMGREVFITKAPVIGFGYSPFIAVVFGLFGRLPLEISTTLWVLLLIGSTAGLGIATLTVVSPNSRKRFFFPFLAVFFTSFPLLHNFKWGQVGVLLTLLLAFALLAKRNERWLVSSLCLALATSLKYFPVLFILPFVFRKDWHVVGGFIAWSALLFIGIPSIFFGPLPTATFLGQIVHGTMNKQIAAGGPNSQFFVNVVVRWASDFLSQPVSLKPFLRVFSFLIVEAMLVFVFLIVKIDIRKSLEWSFVLLFLLVPFFVATSWPHYLVFLPLCQLFLASEAFERNELGWLARVFAGVMTLLSVLLASVFLFQAIGSWEHYTGAGFLLIADALLLTSSVVLLLPEIRRSRWLHALPDAPAPTIAETNQ